MLGWIHHFCYLSGRSHTDNMKICKPDVDWHSFWPHWDETSCDGHCPATHSVAKKKKFQGCGFSSVSL